MLAFEKNDKLQGWQKYSLWPIETYWYYTKLMTMIMVDVFPSIAKGSHFSLGPRGQRVTPSIVGNFFAQELTSRLVSATRQAQRSSGCREGPARINCPFVPS